MSPRDLPPRLPTWLLEKVLPRRARSEAILGDLHEEFAARSRRGRRRARVWYTRQALGIAARYAARSMTWEARRDSLGATGGGRWEGFMDKLVFNLRYAIRRILRTPGFTMVAIVSLALGIGANTAMFTLVNAVLLRDLPFEDSGSLVNVYGQAVGDGIGTLSYPDYEDLVEGTRDVFRGVSGMTFAFMQADTESGVEMLFGEAVTGNYFALTGVQPEVGRLIGPEDDVVPGANPVVVLGHGLWERRFASDPDVVGSELRLGGRAYTVIGVVPEQFTGRLRGFVSDAYVPITMYEEVMGLETGVLVNRGNHSLLAMARLRPGVTVAQAQDVSLRVADDLRARYPEDWTPINTFALVATDDVIVNPTIDTVLAPAGLALMVVVGVVLLIACANLASFLLARAVDRKKEIAVRLAMGARRGTLIRQLLTETLLLSCLGGVLGVALSGFALRALVAADLTAPLGIPLTPDLSPDARVLAFSVLVSVGAGVLFGLVPALQSTTPELASTLRDETAGGGRRRSTNLRNLLVLGQVAASVVLLVGAGLLLRSLDAARDIDPGFGDAPTGILQLNAQTQRYAPEEAQAYFDELERRLTRLPEIEAVGYTTNILLNQTGTRSVRVEVDGVEPPPGMDFHSIDRADVDEGFLEAAGIDLLAGRAFDDSDRDGESVALVNEEFVRIFFGGADALDRTIRVNGVETRVVGVTQNTRVRRLAEAQRAYLMLPLAQNPSSYVTLLARGRGDEAAISHTMVSTARTLDPGIMILLSSTMSRHLGVPLIARELGAGILAGFALLALLLASLGIYGVVSYSVARRAREVGIRMSLGARGDAVVWMLTAQGVKLVSGGLLIGLTISAGLSQLVSRLLYGVPPIDAVTFVTVPAVLFAVALAASWIPARRVTRISPVGALRAE